MKSKAKGIVKRIRASLLVVLICVLFCTGCSLGSGKLKVVFTTGFQKDEIFRIEKMSCDTQELMLYLVNLRNKYKAAYGDDIFSNDDYGEKLSQNIKEMALAGISRIKAMNLFAKEYGVSLNDTEKEDALRAAEIYVEGLSSTETELLNIDVRFVADMYEEYMLARKIYYYIIRDIMPVVSDDEARTITVSQILIKTYYYDIKGVAQPYSKEARQDLFGKLMRIKEEIDAGEDFSVAASKCSEAEVATFSFGKGEYEGFYEETAFNLGTGEVSEVLETEDGYVLIKCLNAYNREETDRNKEIILERRKKEVFNESYDSFAGGLTKMFNEELYQELVPIEDEALVTDNFFDVINEIVEK